MLHPANLTNIKLISRKDNLLWIVDIRQTGSLHDVELQLCRHQYRDGSSSYDFILEILDGVDFRVISSSHDHPTLQKEKAAHMQHVMRGRNNIHIAQCPFWAVFVTYEDIKVISCVAN